MRLFRTCAEHNPAFGPGSWGCWLSKISVSGGSSGIAADIMAKGKEGEVRKLPRGWD
jgi:hypothetical protein